MTQSYREAYLLLAECQAKLMLRSKLSDRERIALSEFYTTMSNKVNLPVIDVMYLMNLGSLFEHDKELSSYQREQAIAYLNAALESVHVNRIHRTH